MPALPQRTLGATHLAVTRIGLGLAALGRPGYINLGHAEDLAHDYDIDAMRERTHQVLDAAWAAGVRYFDAARSYGRAEDFLGSWLAARDIAPDSVAVGSKWGYTYTADWSVEADKHEVKDHTLATLLRQFPESRQRLGRRLDLYQIHSATLDSGVLDRPDVLAELARLRHEEELLIGLSLSGPGQAQTLERALETTVDGQPVFQCVQATWNILEPSAGPALHAAHQQGWGVIIKEGLANGRLTPRGDVLPEPNADAVALAAVLAQPWVDVVLSGAASVEHLHANLQAAAVDPASLDWDRLNALREQPEQYWAQRGALAWN